MVPISKLGLVLGGGGARGMAHIGVLKVLDQAGIQIDCIAGTSMGGVIAAAYAKGLSAVEIESEATHFARIGNIIKLLDPNPSRRGLIEGNRVRNYLEELFGSDSSFEMLRIPLALNAVDLNSGCEVIMKSGPLLPALLATTAVPGLFSPVRKEGYHLVDGGVINNVPVSSAKALGADLVIAVDVQSSPSPEYPWQEGLNELHLPGYLPAFFNNFYQAFLIMIAQSTQSHLTTNPPTILIRPLIPVDLTMFLGFSRSKEAIELGEQACQNALPQIKEILLASAKFLDH
jgi:NTE family protein